ncbi:MAG: DNA translocase FtsK 4TM domain-containing protein [Acidobacteria bacterium]|nr:DNA translocase FtsK 4TM domain-containing protein [Acidobacteriota bacterium]
MATVQTDARMKPKSDPGPPRNTRRNEIIAITLFALSALLALCLVSYNPNDASWSAAGEGGTRNWIGAIGANVAAALYQFFGLAAVLLPLLLVAAAWRRFRTRRIHAPLSRVAGLVTVTLAIASLFALYLTAPLLDGSFNAGGFVGVLIAEALKSMLNTVGTSVMLLALAAVGLLLATNFSFVRASERIAAALSNPSGTFRRTIERFHAWRSARRAQALARVEMRREARAARELEPAGHAAPGAVAESAQPSTLVQRGPKEERVSASVAIKRAAAASTADETLTPEGQIRAQLAQAEAELASIVAQPSITSPDAELLKDGKDGAAARKKPSRRSASDSARRAARPNSWGPKPSPPCSTTKSPAPSFSTPRRRAASRLTRSCSSLPRASPRSAKSSTSWDASSTSAPAPW